MNYKKLTTTLLAAAALCANAQQATIYTTTPDRTHSLSEVTTELEPTRSNADLVLNPLQTFQEMDGFGYAITYSACYNLMQMKAEDRHALLEYTFSPTKGLGISYMRTSIGCSDFSSCEYTLCDEPGLEHFKFHEDETKYVLPVMKEILAINPDVKLMAAPWTCPRWMKVNNLTDRKPHDSWTAGHLNPDYYEEYAQYFVRFVWAMMQEGITVHAVTPQNEPLNAGNCASLVMGWDEQAAFIQHLAPAFKKAGLKTKIYTFDHNYNYDNKPDQNDYPLKIYEVLPADMPGAELVAGSAWHNYGGETAELDDVRQRAPEKEMIFTEASIGTWNQGRDLKKRLIDDMDWMVLPAINKGCRAMMVWNYMLDLNRAPNLDGGCQTCFGAIDIDQNDYKTLHYNSHFYAMAHMSSVVKPGAVRIGAQAKQMRGISYSAFLNPDGTYAVVIANRDYQPQRVSINVKGRGSITVDVPLLSATSVLIGK